MLIQIHILQNYAPANLNRDDTGSPKDAVFGGYRRGRISSQCLKRSIRRSTVFTEAFSDAGLLGMRTRMLPSKMEEMLKKLGANDTEINIILPRISEIGRKSNKSGEEPAEEKENPEEISAGMTKQLIFIGQNELEPMAEKLFTMYRDLGPTVWKKTKIEDITKKLGASVPKSIDIALFGRMTTSDAFEDVQAACQVAHAISTNALTEEFDYFTAVDDLSKLSGAGMISDVEFNSSTYYKYLNIHWEALVSNLGNDVRVARQTVKALIEASATAQPSGKQNSFAAFNLPEMVLVEMSERNLPVSYANAFMKPVRNVHGISLVEASMQQLADHMTRVSKAYNLKPERAYVALSDYKIADIQSIDSLADLASWAVEHLSREA